MRGVKRLQKGFEPQIHEPIPSPHLCDGVQLPRQAKMRTPSSVHEPHERLTEVTSNHDPHHKPGGRGVGWGGRTLLTVSRGAG